MASWRSSGVLDGCSSFNRSSSDSPSSCSSAVVPKDELANGRSACSIMASSSSPGSSSGSSPPSASRSRRSESSEGLIVSSPLQNRRLFRTGFASCQATRDLGNDDYAHVRGPIPGGGTVSGPLEDVNEACRAWKSNDDEQVWPVHSRLAGSRPQPLPGSAKIIERRSGER